jgi:ribosomal protein L37AE/L43A
MDGTILHRMAARFGRGGTPRTPPDLEVDHAARIDATQRASFRVQQHSRSAAGIASCEVCGRTLLDGERAREIRVDDTTLAACTLCVIQYQTGHPRHAA